jgi:hypothetical protein
MLPTLRILLATSLVALAVPAAASAATVTVNPGDNPQEKVASAAAGDTVLFKAGAHSGTVSTGTANLTIKGEPGAALSAPASAEGATPTLSMTGTAAVVEGLTVINQVTTGPAISGSAGLTVRDLIALSSKGNAIAFGAGPNTLLRSTVASLLANGTAVTTTAGPAPGATTLNADSSVLIGKTALAASFSAPSLLGSVAVAARHITSIGGLSADRSLSPTSTLTFTVTDSIIRGTVGAGVTAEAARNNVKETAADAAQLFVRPAVFNYHLRADATSVIDKGQMTEGESSTDVDGNPRVTGSASDLGADEFVNKAPTASLTAAAGVVRQGRAVGFDAAKSSDPEASSGGGIASYHWDFGDGSAADTTTPTTTHAFGERKDYSVTVTVTDKQGLASAASAPVSFTVIDGTAPTVTIGQPGVKQRLNLYKKNKPKRRARVTLFGNATDDTGLSKVVLALRPVASKNGQCRWFDGKSKLKSGPCTAPILLTAKLNGSTWRYVLPLKAKLPRGPYQLVAAAVDTSGLAGDVKTVAFRFR